MSKFNLSLVTRVELIQETKNKDVNFRFILNELWTADSKDCVMVNRSINSNTQTLYLPRFTSCSYF